MDIKIEENIRIMQDNNSTTDKSGDFELNVWYSQTKNCICSKKIYTNHESKSILRRFDPITLQEIK